MTDHQRILRLHRWLQRIEQELRQLAIYNQVFWDLQTIIRTNKGLRNTPSLFFQFIGTSYLVFAATAIRRQSDADQGVASLHRFLSELKNYPHIISRQYYVNMVTATGNIPVDFADRQYDKLVGKKSVQLNPNKIQKELEELHSRSGLIRHYCNKLIAHSDEKGLTRPVPKLREIDNCLRFFEKLIKRYSVLLAGISLSGLTPTMQFDWRDSLKIAWI